MKLAKKVCQKLTFFRKFHISIINYSFFPPKLSCHYLTQLGVFNLSSETEQLIVELRILQVKLYLLIYRIREEDVVALQFL